MHTDRAGNSTGFFWLAPACVVGHLAMVAGTQDWSLRLLLDVVLLVGLLSGGQPRRIAFFALPLWLVLVAYFDVVPLALPLRGEIHVADLYQADLRWFGVNAPCGRKTFPEYFQNHHWPWLDLVCGFVYMTELPEFIPFAVCLYFRDQRRLGCLMWAFMLTNLVAYTIWVLYPAAPPWYVELHGLGPAVLDAPSDTAGLGRVDDILGMDLIQKFYAQSVNVFGAMPSVHVAVPTVVACAAAGMGKGWFLPAGLFTAIMAFGAVYLQHHYVLDVLAGLLCAVTSYVLVTIIARRIAPVTS